MLDRYIYIIYIIIKNIYIYTHIEGPPLRNAFFICGSGPKSRPWWQRRLSTNQPEAFSTTKLGGNQLQRTMFGKVCSSKTGKGSEALMWTNSKDTMLPATSSSLLFKPACRYGITRLPSALTPLVRPDYAFQTRM